MRRLRFRPDGRVLCLALAGVGLCAWPTPMMHRDEAVLPAALAEELGKWIERHQAQERRAVALQERIHRLEAHNQALRERIELLETQLKELTSIEKSLQNRDQVQ